MNTKISFCYFICLFLFTVNFKCLWKWGQEAYDIDSLLNKRMMMNNCDWDEILWPQVWSYWFEMCSQVVSLPHACDILDACCNNLAWTKTKHNWFYFESMLSMFVNVDVMLKQVFQSAMLLVKMICSQDIWTNYNDYWNFIIHTLYILINFMCF